MPKQKTKGFKKETNGKWTIDTHISIDGCNKHITRRGFDSLSQAKDYLEQLKSEFNSNSTRKTAAITYDILIKDYLRMREIVVNSSTLECDVYAINKYITPYFRGNSLDLFNKQNVSKWYRELLSLDLSTNRKYTIITKMKDLLKFAYMHKYISADLYQDCDTSIYKIKSDKATKNERVIWSKEEEERFIKSLDSNEIDKIMFKTFLATSPRLGEFLALQPSCIDKDNNRIIIKQQVKNIHHKGAVLTNKLKTSVSYRSIAISDALAKELLKYVEDFNIKENQFLWHSKSKNKPLSRNSLRRLFNKYCDKANVRKMNIHALRHNQAVKLASVISDGEELEIAARMLGHSPSMFMNTYANHINKEKEQLLLKKLQS